jgi:glutaredoxin 3
VYDGRSFPLPDAFEAEVVVYLTPWCPYCVMARRLLGKRGIPYEIFDVSGNHEAREWLRVNTGQRTVPQIFIKGRSVGGFDELSALDRSGGLAHALA